MLISKFQNYPNFKMENQLIIDSLNKLYNEKPTEEKKIISNSQGWQNLNNNETTYKGSKVIAPDQTLDQIWSDNGLDFKAKPTKIFYKNHKDELIETTEYQGIINNKTGQLLNIPKNSYTILQLATIKKVIEQVRDYLAVESIINIDSKRFVINTYIKGCIADVKKDDPIKRRCTFITSMDSSVGFTLALLDWRMFCFNQMNSVRQSQNMSFKHTASIPHLVERLPRALDLTKHTFKEDIETFKFMARSEITEQQAKETLKKLFENEYKNKIVILNRRTKEQRAKNVYDLVQTKPILENLKIEADQNGLTQYSLHNAITNYYCNQQQSKNIKCPSEASRIRTESNLYGKGKSIIDRSKELCLSIR